MLPKTIQSKEVPKQRIVNVSCDHSTGRRAINRCDPLSDDGGVIQMSGIPYTDEQPIRTTVAHSLEIIDSQIAVWYRFITRSPVNAFFIAETGF